MQDIFNLVYAITSQLSLSSCTSHPYRAQIYITRAICTPLVPIVLSLSMWEIHQSIAWPKKFFKCFSHIVSGSVESVESVGSVGLGLSFVAEMHSKQFVQLSPPSTFRVRVYVESPLSGKSFECAIHCCLSSLVALPLPFSLSCTRIFRSLFASVVFFLRCFFLLFHLSFCILCNRL